MASTIGPAKPQTARSTTRKVRIPISPSKCGRGVNMNHRALTDEATHDPIVFAMCGFYHNTASGIQPPIYECQTTHNCSPLRGDARRLRLFKRRRWCAGKHAVALGHDSATAYRYCGASTHRSSSWGHGSQRRDCPTVNDCCRVSCARRHCHAERAPCEELHPAKWRWQECLPGKLSQHQKRCRGLPPRLLVNHLPRAPR